MTSKIRLLTIFFSFAMLLAFGTVPYVIFIKKGIDSISIQFVTATVMLTLFLAGILAIIWLTLIVKLDKKTKTITFLYPLRFSSTTIKFEDIVGFRYKYLNGRIEYKSLQVKNSAGQTFTFSDFETENLREFENEFIELFELRTGKGFNKLNRQQKDFEIENSKAFDIEQAKEIRFMLFMVIVLIIVVLATFIKKIIDNKILNPITTISMTTIAVTILIMTIRKLKRTSRIIKNSATSP